MALPPAFAERLFDVVRLIPKGRVTTYGHLAAYCGHKGAARTVGWLLHASKNSLEDLPAHRVVNRTGHLSGHMHFGPGRMQALLEAEGVTICENQVEDFATRVWDPSEALTGSF